VTISTGMRLVAFLCSSFRRAPSNYNSQAPRRIEEQRVAYSFTGWTSIVNIRLEAVIARVKLIIQVAHSCMWAVCICAIAPSFDAIPFWC
jgi:hypothetical protein